MAERQACVLDSEAVQDRRVQVMDVHAILHHLHPQILSHRDHDVNFPWNSMLNGWK
jgi:hypothetical protein